MNKITESNKGGGVSIKPVCHLHTWAKQAQKVWNLLMSNCLAPNCETDPNESLAVSESGPYVEDFVQRMCPTLR